MKMVISVGYNENGDFRLSALGDGDLDMPAMNQQEGTLTNMHKRVTPTNAALEYRGYELNDIMKVLVDGLRETIDWTVKLPVSKGFKAVAFDSLIVYLTDTSMMVLRIEVMN